MTRPEVIEHLCRTVSLVYLTKNNFTHASDCFCDKCDAAHFQHQGITLEFVRQAVIEKLIRDGYNDRLPEIAKNLNISLDDYPVS